MTVLESQSARIQLAMRDEAIALQLGDIPDVQARDNYHANGTPFEGLTIHDVGETYGTGTVGTHDAGYLIAFTFVASNTGDALLTTDWLLLWREQCRRRFTDQRLPVGENDGIKHHNIKLQQPAEIVGARNFPNYRIHQLVFAVWFRESRVTPRP